MVTKKARPAERDRASTEGRILDAVGHVLAERGFDGLGVNAIARRAGVDKVLIYRYFGGLPELLAAFARRSAFWPSEEELVAGADGASPDDLAGQGVAALTGLLRGLRSRPMTQEVLRWELAASNELTERFADVREEQGVRVLSRITGPGAGRRWGGVDFAAVAALLSAGATYLVLRSKSAPRWLGVALDDRGFQRLERALETIVRRVLSDPRPRVGRGPGAPEEARRGGGARSPLRTTRRPTR